MKKTHVFYWIGEVSAGCEDLSDEIQPGRPCQINLDTVFPQKLELDTQTMARKLALSLTDSIQTTTNHLQHNLGMKYYHLRRIPDVLDGSQQA
jgi:hypothetical protein